LDAFAVQAGPAVQTPMKLCNCINALIHGRPHLPPEGTRALVVGPLKGIQDVEPMSREKLSPSLGYYIVDGKNAAIDLCAELLKKGGAGHTAGIHSADDALCVEFAEKVDAQIA
jgi:acyl-CoA reductase-like NAD-dependent aldehyde dehydrogenase